MNIGAKEKIQHWIYQLEDMFDEINIKYYYDFITSYHIVYFMPEILIKDQKFLEKYSTFRKDFFNYFPSELLLITRNNENYKNVNLVHQTNRCVNFNNSLSFNNNNKNNTLVIDDKSHSPIYYNYGVYSIAA